MPLSAAAARDDPLVRPGASTAKRAARVADRIVEDVMARGWPVGEVLGSEAQLLERYRVSRAVFREAVRLVERQQVARTRRGPGGGLVVTEPTVDAVIDAVVLYLHRVDARLDEVFEARIVLEELASELAPQRVDEQDLARLRTFTDPDEAKQWREPRALHSLLASISGNAALELFVDVLNRVAMLYTRDWRTFGRDIGGEANLAHARIAEAVIAGDPGLARHRMRKHLEAEAEFLRRRRSTRQLLPDGAVLPESAEVKRAEVVARRIAVTVVGEGMQPGELVGTETELIEREAVSRAVFREAVRLLEHQQIAHMRRGPGGGLVVDAPSAGPVIDAVAVSLARRGLRPADLAELRAGIEVALVGLAADRVDGLTTARLQAALHREEQAAEAEQGEPAHDLHAAVAAAAGNRVLELVALALIRLSRLHRVERAAPRTRAQLSAEMYRAHVAIAEAVEAGDRELARHRMRRHLDAIAVTD